MEASEIMAELVGSSLGELASALDKVILFIGGKKMIETGDVETVLTDTGRKDVFEFAEAVGKRRLSEALYILKKLSEFNENEIKLLSMLARHWRILIKAREALATRNFDRGTLPRLLGIKPFFLDGYLAQARLFTGKELKSGFKRLYLTDKKLKSSKLPKREILQHCVVGLIRGN
jgi:DNA polymerase-3 subunit delta